MPDLDKSVWSHGMIVRRVFLFPGAMVALHAIPQSWPDRLGENANHDPLSLEVYGRPPEGLRVDDGILVMHDTFIVGIWANVRSGYDTNLKPNSDTEVVIWIPEDGMTTEHLPDMDGGTPRPTQSESCPLPWGSVDLRHSLSRGRSGSRTLLGKQK